MPGEKMLNQGVCFSLRFLLEFSIRKVAEPSNSTCLQECDLGFASELS